MRASRTLTRMRTTAGRAGAKLLNPEAMDAMAAKRAKQEAMRKQMEEDMARIEEGKRKKEEEKRRRIQKEREELEKERQRVCGRGFLKRGLAVEAE